MRGIYLTLTFSCLLILNGCRQSIPTVLPNFNLLLIDSTTILNSSDIPKGEATVFMYFIPNCEHCQTETRDIVRNIDKLGFVKIYFLTPVPFQAIKEFSKSYNLDNYPNITVAQDFEYAFYKNFKPVGTPYTVVFDKEKKLIKDYERIVTADDLIELFK